MPDQNSENLSKALTSATKKHVAPIFRENPVKVMFLGTSDKMTGQGTMTFVTYQGHCFGITNQHVTTDFQKVTANAMFILALQEHVPLPGRLVFTSTQRDVDFPLRPLGFRTQ